MQEPQEGSILSPYQFDPLPENLRHSLDVIKEIDTLLWGTGCTDFESFQKTLDDYASAHYEEVVFYSECLDSRKHAVAQMIAIALAARLKLKPNEEN